MGQMGLELFENDYSTALLTFFLLLARALLLVGIVLALFEYAISAQSGGGNPTDTGLSVLKGMAATELFTIIPVKLYALTVQIQTVMGDLLNPAAQRAADAVADQSSSVMTDLLTGALSLFTSMVSSQPLLFVSGFVSGSQSSANAEQHIPGLTTIIFLVVFLISFIKSFSTTSNAAQFCWCKFASLLFICFPYPEASRMVFLDGVNRLWGYASHLSFKTFFWLLVWVHSHKTISSWGWRS